MARGILEVAALPDPVGRVLKRVERPNGLVIEKTAVPMGVIAIIYEPPQRDQRRRRPCHQERQCLHPALRQGYVDLLIPRGGAGLIRACVKTPKSPASRPAPASATFLWMTLTDRIKHWTSLRTPRPAAPACATLKKCAWCIRPLRQSFCPSWLSASARPHGKGHASGGTAAGQARRGHHPNIPAGPQDFDTEFLITFYVKVVDSVDEAIAHIVAHSTGHSEAILTRLRQLLHPLHDG